MTEINKRLHPDVVLQSPSQRKNCLLPYCEHFAGQKKFLDKALQLQIEKSGRFDITCDLEDGIGALSVNSAIDNISSAINSENNKYNRIGIRLLNFYHSDWLNTTEQLIKSCAGRIAYLTLPKVSSYAELVAIQACLQTFYSTYSINKNIPLHVLVECQSVLKDLTKIATHPLVESLDFGIMDYISDLDGSIPLSCINSPEQFSNPVINATKVQIVQTALACGCVATHNVTVAYNDTELTYQDAHTASTKYGFSRMWSVHPSQIDPILNGFKHDQAELDTSAEILLQAYNKEWAPLAYEGKLYDRASYRFLWLSLKRAFANGYRDGSGVREMFGN